MISKEQRSLLLKARRSAKFARSLAEEVRGQVDEYYLPLDEAVRSGDRMMEWLNELVDASEHKPEKGCLGCGIDLEAELKEIGVCGKCAL